MLRVMHKFVSESLASWLFSSGMTTLALTELLGATVYDPSGAAGTRARSDARSAGRPFTHRIADRENTIRAIASCRSAGCRDRRRSPRYDDCRRMVGRNGTEGLFLLERDLLDQQVIDVNGRKVVRVNDVDLEFDTQKGRSGTRPCLAGAFGRCGSARRDPASSARSCSQDRSAVSAGQDSSSQHPWNFVDLIETDPARRVKLKISHEGLAKLHPADIADIVEDLAPDERQAVFQTLDEETAAEALEEVEPRVQKSIVESLDSGKAADIVEEMDPDAAADLLADLPEDRTEQILVQMEPEAQQDVVELLEHKEETAAGRMTTDFLALPVNATVQNAIDSLREFEGGVEAISTIYLVDSQGTLVGAVPLARIVLARRTPMLSLAQEPLVLAHEGVARMKSPSFSTSTTCKPSPWSTSTIS